MTVSLQEKNNRYYAVISYKEDGQYKQKWKKLDLPVKNNKRRAEAMLEDIKKEYEAYISHPGCRTAFVDYIRKWLREKKPLIQVSTWEGYETYAEKHIIPYFEPMNLRLIDVKPIHIRDYYNFKYTNGRLDGKQGGLSIASIKKHSIVIKEALDDAVLADYIQRNPAIGVKLPAKDIAKREKKFMTVDEANAVLKAFDNHPLQGVVYATLYYGLRRSEVLGLRWSAIDFENNTLTINHTVVKNKTIVAKDTTKTQTSHHTYILIEDVKRVLLAQKERQEHNRQLFGDKYKESDYVFTWDDGGLFRPDYITRGFQRQLKRNNVPTMNFHSLRHSTASILHDKGWDLRDVQEWLRHSSIDVTADIYMHISRDRNKIMAKSLESLFNM